MKKSFILKFAAAAAAACFMLPVNSFAQKGYVPAPENIQARQEFSDARFGIFIHWGLYAMLATGEWTMTNNNLHYQDYAHLADAFYPSQFNAREWVREIKNAGAGYITLTSRHHDGFSLWNTKMSDFNVMNTPFGRDIIAELAEACREEGIKLNLYYSHLDWTRLDYPLGRTGLGTGRPKDQQNYDSYLAFMKGQLTELLTNYGPIGAIWFDGVWDHDRDRTPFDWRLDEQYELIHKLQPACLVANNHHVALNPGEDIQIFERDLPGENTAGYSGDQEVSVALPLETCQTMNGMWGYKMTDRNYKSSKTLIQYLVRAAGKGANLLLNIGPQADGQLPELAISRLREMGEWMSVYGSTIKCTKGGPVAPHSWGVTTSRDDKVFVHILNLEDNSLFLPLEGKVAKAVMFKDGTPVKFTKVPGGITLTLEGALDKIDTVVELTMDQGKGKKAPAAAKAAPAAPQAPAQPHGIPSAAEPQGSGKVVASPDVPKAVGPYSQAIEAGNTLYLSGQLPINAADGKMPESVEDQTRQSLTNIGHVLKAAGMSYGNVVKTTVLLADIKDFAAMNAVYATFFSGAFPARVCYQVAALPNGAKVEIDAVAVR